MKVYDKWSVLNCSSFGLNVGKMSFKCIFLLALTVVSAKSEEALFQPCNKDDINCIRTATQTFMSKTYAGEPKLGIKAVDPFNVPPMQIVIDEDLGLVFDFKRTITSGLKNLKIEELNMDLEHLKVVMKTKTEVGIVGDIGIQLTNLNKNFNGLYEATATVLGKSEYSLSLKEANGQKYFIMGPETNTCEIEGEPKITLGNQLQETLNKDHGATSLRGDWEAKKVALRKKTICALIRPAYETVIQNLRTLASAIPTSAFFNDV